MKKHHPILACLPFLLLCSPAFSEEALTYSETELRAIAQKYAPVIFQEIDRGTVVDKSRGREDFITAVDFDGDMRANNNWENMSKFPLLPIVYYSLIESETHLFISYSLYHPRDWSRVNASYTQHENDMENIQLVINKEGDGRLVLIMTQTHLASKFTATDSGGVTAKNGIKLGNGVRMFDDAGLCTDKGDHVGIFIERKGHGIYSVGHAPKLAGEYRDGRLVELKKKRFSAPVWEKFPIIQYTPSKDGVTKRQPTINPARKDGQVIEHNVPYALESVYHRFWLPITRGELYGDGKLFDGSFSYKDNLFDLKRVPRFFDSDKTSGPFKKDAGVTPFALGISLMDKNLGNLFFNPAQSYPKYFNFTGKWSKHYIYNPYLNTHKP